MAHDTPKSIQALSDQCVRCGLCSAVCPTYALTGLETESPRGRITAMQAMASEDRPDDSLLQARDHCLGCLQCQQLCPSRVQFATLMDHSRAQHPPRLPATERWLLRAVASPLRLKATAAVLPLLRPWLLSRGFPPSDPCPPREQPPARPRGKVALFLGCVARWADGKTLADTRWLIQQAGFAVADIPAQGCCGALHQHAGQTETARRMLEANRKAFENGADWLLYSASGCAPMLEPLKDALPVAEAFHWLVQRLPAPALQESRRLALHLPCSLRQQPEAAQTLRQYVEQHCQKPVLLLDNGCCGAGGAHLLRFPERAAALRQPLLDALEGVDLLLSSNIGCALHLRAGLYQQGRDLPVQHPLSWLRNLHEENPTCTL